jgi:hypothetical protein
MLFVAVNEHDSKQCPLKTDEGVKMLKNIFSDENMKKNDIKLEDAYVSCHKEEHSIHKGFFIVNAKSAENVKNFFGPMEVEVKEVLPFSEVAKSI